MQDFDCRIDEGYKDLTSKAEAVSSVLAEVVSDVVVLSANNHDGWTVSYDKNPSKV